MSTPRIVCLSERPALVATVARWHWEEWGNHDPHGSVEEWTERLADRIHPDRIPTTFVALAGDDPIGSASLVEHDMRTRRDLSPWLAGVFVVPEWRRRGVGSALVRHTVDRATTFGVARLYLYTNGAESLYEELGWRIRERELYEGREVTIMERVPDVE